MIHRTGVATKQLFLTFAFVVALTFGFTALAGQAGATSVHPVAKAKSGVLKGYPSNRTLATEFLRLLKAKDKPGLRRFLDPAFLLQRGETGSESYLNKQQYLADPSVVNSFRVRGIVANRSDNVRVVRFEANTAQLINGQPVPAEWVPRLSTFIKTKGTWRLIAHANFIKPPA